MTVYDLINELQKYPVDTEVEIMDDDGNNSRGCESVDLESVTRGYALPKPVVKNIIILSSGWEGL